MEWNAKKTIAKFSNNRFFIECYNEIMRIEAKKKHTLIHRRIQRYSNIIMNMSGVETLYVFKRGLKKMVRNDVMMNNHSIMNKTIVYRRCIQ